MSRPFLFESKGALIPPCNLPVVFPGYRNFWSVLFRHTAWHHTAWQKTLTDGALSERFLPLLLVRGGFLSLSGSQ